MSARRALRSFICGLGGHELLRSFEPNRVCLRCTSCSYETPGWTLKDKPGQQQQSQQHHALNAAFIAQTVR